ncbi:MAG TPA: glycerate kinase [Ramlibacter sp.]|nr:glycerate kinase [Ramlibacter sp.]
MNWKRILVPIAALIVIGAAWRAYGLGGLAVATGVMVMWALLHFNRLMHVLRQASDRPIGHVASAVMLNAKLRPGVTLLHVMALTKAIGEQLSPKDEEPEVYRWTDQGGSQVTCEFAGGKLARWKLERPEQPVEPA